MSKDFVLHVSWILVLPGLIFMFPDFFADEYQYLRSHEYIFILIFDLILLTMYLLTKYNLKIQQNIFIGLALVVLGISTFIYSYVFGTKLPIYTIMGVMFAYMFCIANKVEKITKPRKK